MPPKFFVLNDVTYSTKIDVDWTFHIENGRVWIDATLGRISTYVRLRTNHDK